MKGSTKKYLKGLTLLLVGAVWTIKARGSESFPISGVILGLGFVLIVWSYLE